MKKWLSIIFLMSSSVASAEWTEFSTRSNGDVYFFDTARVEKMNNLITVWIRVKYKTSVMAASSYQSLSRLDCNANSETVLQSTFYTEKDWTKPAMATNTNVKPEKKVEKNSAIAVLINSLCKS